MVIENSFSLQQRPVIIVLGRLTFPVRVLLNLTTYHIVTCYNMLPTLAKAGGSRR